MYFEELRAAAIREAGIMEAQYNDRLASIYERSLQDAALNLTTRGTPAPHIIAAAKQRFIVDPESLVFTIVTLNEPVSTKKLADFMPAPAANSPGYPIGDPNAFGGFIMLDSEHSLGEYVTVGNRRFQAVSINNSPFARQYVAV